ncbi:late secretory pathway protein avl9 [Podila horticola]|nr:late secretory pathway protein avl9 [Podila horticola]
MGLILHIIVVGFHHAHGPIVEYAFPPFPGQSARTQLGRLDVPEEWSLLPFLALPDGSHQSDEDFTYFHLPPVKSRKDVDKTLFGISCNRQILTKDLMVKTDDVTRSSVQKAVVVLATQQFYDSLNATISENIPDSAFLMGTSLRELVKKFKYKVLVLLKLLLLERRVIFFGYPVETLCTYQYSLMSLVPGLLKALQDTGSPLLDSQELYMQSMSKTPAHSTEKHELFKYLGLPLHIFGEGSFFQPYLPLQQIDILQDPRTRSYIIGTTNAIFLHNRDCGTDVIVNTEPGTIEFLQDSLSTVLSLTSADRRWMDEIIEAVNDSGSNDAETEYAGSDDYLRAKFEEYILTLLSSVKHSQFTQVDDSIDSIGNAADRNMTSDYGNHFIKAWQQTPNYQLWNDFVDWELLNEIVAPGHPCQGNFSLAHVQRRLAKYESMLLVFQFKDMRIDKNLVPLKQSFSRAMTTNTVWHEFEKLQPEDSAAEGSLGPSLYSTRTNAPDSKGLIQSTSTNPVVKPTARSVPDPEHDSEDDTNDAIVPSTSSRGSPVIHSAPTGSRSGSITGSPVSFTSSLGPATAATAALGQKAAGMFSNVSSFFQAKKKELIDAQREAEEQYQQRIHQHERKKKIMQERAKATASTFAISPKPSSRSAMSPETGSSHQSPGPEIYAYVSPRPARRSSSVSTKNTTVGTEPSDPSATKSSSPADEPTIDSAGSVPIIAPIPVVPVMLVPQSSPTLTRGNGVEYEGVNKESQLAIEKELMEALETVEDSRLNPAALRSITPAETYTPFTEISAPSSPAVGVEAGDSQSTEHKETPTEDAPV